MKIKILSTLLVTSLVASNLVYATDATSSATEGTEIQTTTPNHVTTRKTVNPVVPTGNQYVVKSGDNLSNIAHAYGTEFWVLAEYNNIDDPTLIYPGQTIQIPSNYVSKTPTTSTMRDYSGTYVGFSWRGEAKGDSLQEATQKIETILTLDKDGIITDLDINFLKKSGDDWILRDNTNADIAVDFTVDPTTAYVTDDYEAGDSMFSIKTNDMMSLYAVAVDTDGTVAFGLVDPITRYLYEAKFEPGFDFNTKFGDVTINNGFVPTVRTSTSGMIKVNDNDWSNLNGKSLLDLNTYSHVINLRGTFEGLNNDSTVQEMLEMAGVTFQNATPNTLAPTHGFASAGGWDGNYEAIAKQLIGKDATKLTGLTNYDGTNYSGKSYSDGINEENFFGLNTDTVSSATKTIQNSYDTISGATVRVSRENTSFQRALVAAGIIEEKDVIKGRF